MKKLTYILVGILSLFLISSCDKDFIDPISKKDPGTDESAPAVTIYSPGEGSEIELPEDTSVVIIDIEVTDDIEIASVTISLNGTQIESYTEFKDYRRLLETITYDKLVFGNHTLTVTATDVEGKSTTQEVNFTKSPPYIPKYPGEILYMPFEGTYMNMVTFDTAGFVGTPGFSNESLGGSKSYAGAPDSYLTFPAESFQNNELTAIFWMNINSVPDRAGVLTMGPEDTDNPDAQNVRTSGFRLFRENVGGMQRFKLNAGNGSADSWFDGGANADVDPSLGEWVHIGFTIAADKCVVYIDGQVAAEGDFAGIDWTGCDVLSIMSGAPRFTGWGHLSDESLMDELRMFDRALTQEEIQGIITEESGKDFTYTPKYNGEIFYMPFEEDFLEYVSQNEATMVGTPGFSDEGKIGKAYSGAADSYLTFPTDNLKNDQFSATFWMKVNATPNRAGILTMGPEDTANPDAQNIRTNGFRFFREDAGGMQRFKLNAGNGTADSWFDGGANADVDPAAGEWVHFAFTLSGTEGVIYINGEIASQGAFEGTDWTGCDILSIMSGAPRFTGWSHLSDESLMDELRIFNKALTQEEVQTIIADEQ